MFALDPKPKALGALWKLKCVFPSQRRLMHFAAQPRVLQYVLLHTAWVDDLPIILVKNSKAGCTSAAQALYHRATGGYLEGNIHVDQAVLRQGYDWWEKSLERLREDSGFWRLTTVRHPVDRAISAYKDFASRKNPSWVRHKASFYEYGLIEEPIGEPGFRKFLKFIYDFNEFDEVSVDRHFRKQVLNIGYGYVRYDLIGRIEEFATWGKHYFGTGGYDGVTPKFNRTQSAQFNVNAKTKALLKNNYLEDFEVFEYKL